MLKKCVAWACTLLVGGAMVFSVVGCGEKKPAAPPAQPPAGDTPPAETPPPDPNK